MRPIRCGCPFSEVHDGKDSRSVYCCLLIREGAMRFYAQNLQDGFSGQGLDRLLLLQPRLFSGKVQCKRRQTVWRLRTSRPCQRLCRRKCCSCAKICKSSDAYRQVGLCTRGPRGFVGFGALRHRGRGSFRLRWLSMYPIIRSSKIPDLALASDRA